jgi:hypothetical protein
LVRFAIFKEKIGNDALFCRRFTLSKQALPRAGPLFEGANKVPIPELDEFVRKISDPCDFIRRVA